jgi:hypothetical protein
MIAGSLPIVLAAPHGGREALPGVAVRHGVGIAQFVTTRDTRTDELAEAAPRRAFRGRYGVPLSVA